MFRGERLDALWHRAGVDRQPVVGSLGAGDVYLSGQAEDCDSARIAGHVIRTPTTIYPDVFVPLHGAHQGDNASIALTAAGGRRLVTAARERGVLLTVFHNRRWDGDLRTLQRLLDADALGSVHRFESRFERWRPALRPGAWRESERPEAGGGLLLDLGSHLVDQALLLFGQPRSVHAEVDRRRAGVQSDDDVFIALEHPGGVRSHLWASSLAAQVGPRLRVLGDRGAYVKHGLDVQEELLRAGRRPTEPGWGREPQERWGWLGVDGEARRVETEPGAYQLFYAGLAEALTSGGLPPVDPNDAVVGLGVLDAARQSAASGTTVRV